MQLFHIQDPANGPQLPGLPVFLEPEPHVHLGKTPSGQDYAIPLGRKMAEFAQLAIEVDPENKLLAADLILKRDDQQKKILIQERGWNNPYMRKARWALVHLEAGRGEGDALLLTGPKGLPELVETDSKTEVVRPWLPFSEAVGVYLVSDDVCSINEFGIVKWKETGGESSFVTLTMCKGASFRVVRTNFKDQPQEFTVSWNGHNLHTNVMRRRTD
jgi:hypothetical protein